MRARRWSRAAAGACLALSLVACSDGPSAQEEVGGDRFTVGLLAAEGATARRLADAVLPTMAEGPCP